jgi:hypothetical protein
MDSEPLEFPQNLWTGLTQMADALVSRNLRYALIGGIAVGFRSRPRFTRDIDFLIDIPQVALPGLLDELQERGFTLEIEKAIREWTRDHLTVLAFRDVRIDWLKPVVPLYRHVIEQAKHESWRGLSVSIASPECLILTKLIAFRTQDQVDIENLLVANSGQLNLAFIRAEWETVAPGDDPRMQRFFEMIAKFYRAPT